MGESKPNTKEELEVNLQKTSSCPLKTLGYLRSREEGGYFKNDTVVSKYYKNVLLRNIWIPEDTVRNGDHGAIFNVEFSPEGRLLLAACEKQSFLVFDPLSQRLIKCMRRAHTDCVNCVRFLDTRSFVTCSDDATIALWDVRNLSEKLSSLKGHTSWVKSIEYHKPSGSLISSAFDDNVRVWDLNRYSDSGTHGSSIAVRVRNLTRMKLSPDGSKMVVSAIAGCLTVIHGLNLDYLASDLSQDTSALFYSRTSQPFDYETDCTNSDRNRVERIKDFCVDTEPLCISSLDIHPHGWALLSRYSEKYSRNEYTTVHDLQETSSNRGTVESLQTHSGASQVDKEWANRLTHTAEEASTARGYIKEHCFSSDGRVICSPFGNTARILSFNPSCDELSKTCTKLPVELYELKTLISHKHPVLTCRFSPTLPLIATGCLGGRVGFSQPHF